MPQTARTLAKPLAPMPLNPAVSRPLEQSLQTGDLIWPRSEDQVVTWGLTPVQSQLHSPAFERERQELLSRMSACERASAQGQAIAAMSYAQFAAFEPAPATAFAHALAAPQPEASPELLQREAMRHVWVGHVGIVQQRGAELWVIDAMPERAKLASKGVDAQPYSAWLNARPDAHVWHGRLKCGDDQRTAVADEAMKQVGRPYSFFRFDMDDLNGFYCSKLIWWAAWKGAGLDLDGKGTSRAWWFSPYQAMKSPHVALLHVPEPYLG